MKNFIKVLLVGLLIFLAPTCKANAGWLNGDESLAGLSFYLDKCYNHEELPQEYDSIRKRGLELYLNPVSNKEYDILCRIVEAEATGGTVKQKINVASCILARVNSKNWPNTIEGVVFQNDGKAWQFSPISDGRYYTVKVQETTRTAVDIVLRYGCTHSCLFFCTKKSYEKPNSWHRRAFGEYKFYDGEHCYFEEES